MKKIIMAAAVLFSVGAHAQSTSHGVHLQKGQMINSVTSAETDIDFSMGTMKNNLSAKAMMTVIGEDPSSYTLTLQTISMKMLVDGMGQSMTFDSEKPEDMNGEVGKSFAGKFSKLDTFQVAKKDGKTTLLSQPSEEQENPMMSMGNQQNNGFSGAFLVIPSSQVGYSWMDSATVKATKTKTTYTVQSIDNGVATVKQSSIMDGTNEFETQGMTMNMTINMKTEAIIKVNIQNGTVISNNSNIDMSGSMDAMGQQIPMTSKIVSTSSYQ